MLMKKFLTLFVILTLPCMSYEVLHVSDGYLYEIYDRQDRIPAEDLKEALQMYYEAYLYPRLHENIPLSELRIDESRFQSYEEFIADMFKCDFESYEIPAEPKRIVIQARLLEDNKIVGMCAILETGTSGYYYIDHIGTHKDFRRQGIATVILDQIKIALPDYQEISLDTRIFNWPAQLLYEKNGFQKCEFHPNPQKQKTYYHYVLQSPTLIF